jgi:AcrR family transcriptional regulator
MDMKTRKYDMSTRDAAKLATRDAILQACVATFMAEGLFGITLAAVAERAGVTVKTVLRHFGSREDLIDAAWSRAYDEVIAERTVTLGNPDAALRVLIEHYERRGAMVLAALAEEDADPRARRMCDTGRLAHRAWVEQVFGDRLPRSDSQRCRLVDVLVVATDVYSWKLLRLDRGLGVDDVRDRMALMTEAALEAS